MKFRPAKGALLKASTKLELNFKPLQRKVYTGQMKALARSAGYIQKVASRKIRRSKKSSVAGQPPRAHTESFKKSIRFGIDERNTTAYIGPGRFYEKRLNEDGKPVPNILEFGGKAALGMNPNWIHKRVNGNIRDKDSIARYFRGLGKGPIAWGNTIASANRNAKGASKQAKLNRHPKRYSPILQRKVYLKYIKITSDKQAQMVAQTVIDVFGYPQTNKSSKIEARPLMAPSMQESKSKVMQFFNNSVK